MTQISNERLAEMLAEVEIDQDNAVADAEADQNPQLAIDAVGEFDLAEMRSIITELQALRPYKEELEKIAADLGEPDDPFAAWEALVALRASSGVEVKNVWNDGEPPKPFRDEWFIALTIHGDRVVLRSLPEEWTYDYKTADETYIMAKNIKKWMQFPDSQFKPYASPLPTVEVTEEMVLAGARGIWRAGNTGLPFELAPPVVVDGLMKQSRAAITAALSQNKGG